MYPQTSISTTTEKYKKTVLTFIRVGDTFAFHFSLKKNTYGDFFTHTISKTHTESDIRDADEMLREHAQRTYSEVLKKYGN